MSVVSDQLVARAKAAMAEAEKLVRSATDCIAQTKHAAAHRQKPIDRRERALAKISKKNTE